MAEKDLQESIENLAKYEKKLSNLSWNFWRGVIYGFGFFIGSAILAALLIYILSRLENGSTIGTFIHNIIESAKKTQS